MITYAMAFPFDKYSRGDLCPGGTDLEKGYGDVRPWRPPFHASPVVRKGPNSSKRVSSQDPLLRKFGIFFLYSLNLCQNFSSQAPKFGNFQLTSPQNWKFSVHKPPNLESFSSQTPSFRGKYHFASPTLRKSGPHTPTWKKVECLPDLYPHPHTIYNKTSLKQYCKLPTNYSLNSPYNNTLFTVLCHSCQNTILRVSLAIWKHFKITKLFDLTFEPFYCQNSYPLTVNKRILPHWVDNIHKQPTVLMGFSKYRWSQTVVTFIILMNEKNVSISV